MELRETLTAILSNWRSWGAHTLVWEALLLAGLMVFATARVLGLSGPVAFAAIVVAWLAGLYFYATRERTQFLSAWRDRDWVRVADALADFLIPLLVSSATLAGLAAWLV